MPLANLPYKPNAPLSYELFNPSSNSSHDGLLVVFINGLGLPSMSWKAAISIFQESATSSKQPPMLTYDRYGQGATMAKDPTDEQPGKEPGYGHDFNDVVNDLHELLETVDLPGQPALKRRLVFVAASIGVHLARLYAQKYPGTVAGLLLLDSNIGNAEFTDLFPNPDAADFKESDVVADDCSMEQYTTAYTRMAKMFNSDVKSPEGLDRRNVKHLLPDPAAPKLQGPDGKAPWLVVVGHDPERFAMESAMMIEVPKSLTEKFAQPAWHRYNEGLLKLSDPERTTGVVIAPGCGHFIQKDNPKFVATQLQSLLEKVHSEL